MRQFHSILCGVLLLAFVGQGQRALCGADTMFYARSQAYIDTALLHINTSVQNPDANPMPIEAYMHVPIDTNIIRGLLNGIATGSTADFEYEQLVRVLYFAPGVYDSMIVQALRPVHFWLNSGDTTDCYWSENHMAQWMSSHWLLHERYGFYADSNLRTRLIHYLDLKNQYKYYEFYSTIYNPYCLAGILNLADFSQDTVIKNLAVQASQVLMEDFMALTNDKGVIFPTAGRNYSDAYDGAYGQNHNDIIWLLTGMGPTPGGASHGGAFLSTTTVPVYSVIQSWVPTLDTVYYRGHSLDMGYALNSYLDSTDRIIFQWSSGAYFNPQYAQESYILIADSNLWHNSSFSVFEPLSNLGAQTIPSLAASLYTASTSSILCSDTIAVFKHNSVTLSSAEDYWPGYWGYQQYPCVAAVETTAVYTASGVVDSIWGDRNATNENDDLPYVKQVKNVALEMYRPLPKNPIVTASNPTVSLHWQNGDYTEVRNDSLWLLGRVDNNYVGVRRSCVGQINGVWACDITPGSSWVIVVGDSIMYGSFNNFQAVIDSSKFSESWYYDSVNHLSDYFAQIIIGGDTINHVWGIDSSTNTGIKAIEPNTTGLNIYPNPANTGLNIALDNVPINGIVEVYNAIGEMIYQSPMTGKAMSIPTGQWSEGMYAVRVSSYAGTTSRCFVVSH